MCHNAGGDERRRAPPEALAVDGEVGVLVPHAAHELDEQRVGVALTPLAVPVADLHRRHDDLALQDLLRRVRRLAVAVETEHLVDVQRHDERERLALGQVHT
jgi:hypothetical protein